MQEGPEVAWGWRAMQSRGPLEVEGGGGCPRTPVWGLKTAEPVGLQAFRAARLLWATRCTSSFQAQ